MNSLVKDMTGLRFGRLLVISRAGSTSRGNARWNCVCDCGNHTNSIGFTLRNGTSRSCGCLSIDMSREKLTIHAMTGTTEYRTWGSMIQRCTNQNNTKYHIYGGRGITVCDRWRMFANFYEDMGPKPSRAHSIERRDRDGNYEPSNCHWATFQEQNKNTSRSRLVYYKGAARSLTEAVRMAGHITSFPAAKRRIDKGWSVDDAVETPPKTDPSETT